MCSAEESPPHASPQVTPTPAPFEWNGHNYLMKMLQDCNFLDRVQALRGWLGFQVSGNPFLLPQQSCVGKVPDNGFADQRKRGPDFGFDKTGLADVGKQPWLGPLQLDIVEESQDLGADKGMRSKKRRLRKRGAVNSLAPYAAAVVNDPTLLPAVKAPDPAGSSNPYSVGLKNGPGTDAPPGKATVDIEGLVPNLVSREDAQRICVARQVLLEEQVRVQGAEKALPQAADQESDNRRRSRASSIVPDAVPSATRNNSRASASSDCGSPTKPRVSHFGPQHPGRKNRSSVSPHDFGSRTASSLQGSGDLRSIVLTTAGLLHQPPAEAHPGLGPVLLQSHRPGGELHPNPFLHTVSDARSAQTEDLEMEVTIRTRTSADKRTTNRCSTAPLDTASSTDGLVRGSNTRDAPRRPSGNHSRAVTAPAKLPGRSSSTVSPSFSGQGVTIVYDSEHAKHTPRTSCPGATTPKVEDSEQPGPRYLPRGQGLSRKAGAELRALTAAGTTGRRQPPPREARLRRLARDVARHSAELRRLVREEEQLRKGLARCGAYDGSPRRVEICRELQEDQEGQDAEEDRNAVAVMVSVRRDDRAARRISFGDTTVTSRVLPAKRVRALVEGKRREIELKTFDLGVKRDELCCLRMVQKQERERRLSLKMERRRARLEDGRVRGVDTRDIVSNQRDIVWFNRGVFLRCCRIRCGRTGQSSAHLAVPAVPNAACTTRYTKLVRRSP